MDNIDDIDDIDNIESTPGEVDSYRRTMSEVVHLRRHVNAGPLKVRAEGWSLKAYRRGSLSRYLNWLQLAETKLIQSWPPDFETAVGFV